jgi:hypothetical protein
MPTKCVECNKKQAFFNRVGETQARYCKPCALKIWPNEKALTVGRFNNHYY